MICASLTLLQSMFAVHPSGVAKELDLQGSAVTRKSSDMLSFRRKVVH